MVFSWALKSIKQLRRNIEYSVKVSDSVITTRIRSDRDSKGIKIQDGQFGGADKNLDLIYQDQEV